ncbi:MAG: Asp-tRNA(Asn)/Glu-tRNA(Gln) amidotransferase subunit GatC [Candidatus Latescibacterota bacterium]|nr:Asp-tRNA(Asn)/Glu-tRNA(Gln) amidotransferase subunit GatC [Candidatus Latescibacterota bacterium]
MAVTVEDVRRVASLARIQLTEQEEGRLTSELTRILDYMAKLDELDTEDVEPTAHVVRVSNAFRSDRREDFPARAELLAQAPDLKEGYFRVPRIID